MRLSINKEIKSEMDIKLDDLDLLYNDSLGTPNQKVDYVFVNQQWEVEKHAKNITICQKY